MARLVTSGFELNSLTAGVEFEYIEPNSCSIVASPVRSGAYALKVLANNSRGYVELDYPACAAGRTFYYRAYLNIKTSVSEASGILAGMESVRNWYIVLNTNDTLQLKDSAGTNIGSASAALAKDTWYRIEVSYAYTGGTCTARLNGTEFASGTATASGALRYLLVGIGVTDVNIASGEIYFDDIAINDDQGAYQNSWPGSGNVIRRRPNAAGESAQWLRAGADSGANWSQCNTLPPDDATAYVRATTLNALDMYAITNFGLVGTETVNVVEVGVRFCRSASVSPGFKVRLVKTAGGTQALSAEITPDSDTWRTNANAVPRTSPIIAYLDPDGQPWTPIGTLDSLQAGVVETTDTNRYIWVTEIWVTVDYTPVEAVYISGPTETEVTTEDKIVSVSAQSALNVSAPYNVLAAVEALVLTLFCLLSPTNSVLVSEAVQTEVSVQSTLSINVYDSAAATEEIMPSVPSQSDLSINVYSNTLTTEAVESTVSSQPTLSLDASDSILTTESAQTAVASQPDLSVDVTESVITTEVPQAVSSQVDLSVNVYDSALVTEVAQSAVSAQSTLTVNVQDQILATEQASVSAITDLSISVTANAAIADVITSIPISFGLEYWGDGQPLLPGPLNTGEMVYWGDGQPVNVYFLSAASVVISTPAVTDLNIPVADAVAVTVVVTPTVAAQSTLTPAVQDTVVVQEATSGAVSAQPTLTPQAIQICAVTEAVGAQVASQTTLTPSVSEAVAVTEQVGMAVAAQAGLTIAVQDQAATQESVQASSPQADLAASIVDWATIAEVPQTAVPAQPTLQIDVQETALATEQTQTSLLVPVEIGVADAVATQEDVASVVSTQSTLLPSVQDIVAVQEAFQPNIASQPAISPSVQDVVVINEGIAASVSSQATLQIQVQDAVAAAEDVQTSLLAPLEISVADAVATSEAIGASVQTQATLSPSVTDLVSLTEQVNVESFVFSLNISVQDEVKATEQTSASVAAQAVLSISVSEQASIQEQVENLLVATIEITAAELVSVQEQASLSVQAQVDRAIGVQEQVSTQEQASINLPLPGTITVSIQEQVAISEQTIAAIASQPAILIGVSEQTNIQEQIATQTVFTINIQEGIASQEEIATFLELPMDLPQAPLVVLWAMDIEPIVGERDLDDIVLYCNDLEVMANV